MWLGRDMAGSDDDCDDDEPVIYDDVAVGALPNKKICLALVNDDDSDAEDLLCLRKRKQHPSAPAPRPVRAAHSPSPPSRGAHSRGQPTRSPRGGTQRGRAAPVAADPDDLDDDVELEEDPVYLQRKRELEAARKRLIASSAVELPPEPPDEAEVVSLLDEDAPPPAPSPPPPPKVKQPPARKILIKVRTSERAEPYTVQVRANKPLSLVVDNFVQKFKADPRRAQLMFDGDHVRPEDTPESLGIEDDDQLDFKVD